MRSANLDPDNVPRKRQRKFLKLEREVVRCGDDIQHLQRFVNAQAIGFRKILKKYRVCYLYCAGGADIVETFAGR